MPCHSFSAGHGRSVGAGAQLGAPRCSFTIKSLALKKGTAEAGTVPVLTGGVG